MNNKTKRREKENTASLPFLFPVFSLLDENCNYRQGHKDTRENTQKLPESRVKCVGLFFLWFHYVSAAGV